MACAFSDYRQFFRQRFLLLLFAVALLASGVERVIGMGWLPPLVDPLWDSPRSMTAAAPARWRPSPAIAPGRRCCCWPSSPIDRGGRRTTDRAAMA